MPNFIEMDVNPTWACFPKWVIISLVRSSDCYPRIVAESIASGERRVRNREISILPAGRSAVFPIFTLAGRNDDRSTVLQFQRGCRLRLR